MSEHLSPFQDLRKLSDRALSDAETWPDLAAYIDALNDEYQWFMKQINDRRIGAHIPRIGRPNRG